jgi:predicted N-acetyltransferase YhbS
MREKSGSANLDTFMKETTMSSASTQVAAEAVTIRRAQPSDVEVCGRICYEAFTTLNRHHNFPPDFPSPAAAVEVLSSMFGNPGFFSVVAEKNGKILGSNCMDERSLIAGIGPITVDPAAQDLGAGRQLMAAVMDRAAERHFPGIRLVQAAFHRRSMSLYAKLGFDIREPLAVMQGPPIRQVRDGYTVRLATSGDLDACDTLCRRVHGHDRSGELADDIAHGTGRVVEHSGRITAYTSDLGFFGHSVAEGNKDLYALLGAADQFAGPGFLLPTRNGELFRWCLSHGLRMVEPMTLMTVGLYNEPAGAFLPSILY